MRPATASTSPSLWLMNAAAVPPAASVRMTRNSSSEWNENRARGRPVEDQRGRFARDHFHQLHFDFSPTDRRVFNSLSGIEKLMFVRIVRYCSEIIDFGLIFVTSLRGAFVIISFSFRHPSSASFFSDLLFFLFLGFFLDMG